MATQTSPDTQPAPPEDPAVQAAPPTAPETPPTTAAPAEEPKTASKPKQKAKAKAKPKPEDTGVSAQAWALGDAALQVPLAGLLADDPTLKDAKLPDREWRKLLDDYSRSERSK